MNKFETVFIELTNVCDKECKHCFNSVFNNVNPSEIAIEQLKKLGSILKSLEIKTLKIVGGEPSLHSNFKEAIEVLDQIGIPYIIYTDNDKIVQHIKSFQKSPYLKHLRISIDGNQKSHDNIRGKGDYNKIISSIDILNKSNIPIKINYTINKLNYLDINEVYEMASSKNVEIKFSMIKIAKNEYSRELVFSEEESLKLFNYLSDYKKMKLGIYKQIMKSIADNSLFICSQKTHNNKEHIGCLAGQKSFVVDSYGSVWPCSLLKGEGQFNYGNIFFSDSKKIIKKMNKEWSSFTRKFDGCETCKFNSHCTGGCRSNAFYTNNINGKDPNCIMYSNIYHSKLKNK